MGWSIDFYISGTTVSDERRGRCVMTDEASSEKGRKKVAAAAAAKAAEAARVASEEERIARQAAARVREDAAAKKRAAKRRKETRSVAHGGTIRNTSGVAATRVEGEQRKERRRNEDEKNRLLLIGPGEFQAELTDLENNIAKLKRDIQTIGTHVQAGESGRGDAPPLPEEKLSLLKGRMRKLNAELSHFEGRQRRMHRIRIERQAGLARVHSAGGGGGGSFRVRAERSATGSPLSDTRGSRLSRLRSERRISGSPMLDKSAMAHWCNAFAQTLCDEAEASAQRAREDLKITAKKRSVYEENRTAFLKLVEAYVAVHFNRPTDAPDGSEAALAKLLASQEEWLAECRHDVMSRLSVEIKTDVEQPLRQLLQRFDQARVDRDPAGHAILGDPMSTLLSSRRTLVEAASSRRDSMVRHTSAAKSHAAAHEREISLAAQEGREKMRRAVKRISVMRAFMRGSKVAAVSGEPGIAAAGQLFGTDRPTGGGGGGAPATGADSRGGLAKYNSIGRQSPFATVQRTLGQKLRRIPSLKRIVCRRPDEDAESLEEVIVRRGGHGRRRNATSGSLVTPSAAVDAGAGGGGGGAGRGVMSSAEEAAAKQRGLRRGRKRHDSDMTLGSVHSARSASVQSAIAAVEGTSLVGDASDREMAAMPGVVSGTDMGSSDRTPDTSPPSADEMDLAAAVGRLRSDRRASAFHAAKKRVPAQGTPARAKPGGVLSGAPSSPRGDATPAAASGGGGGGDVAAAWKADVGAAKGGNRVKLRPLESPTKPDACNS